MTLPWSNSRAQRPQIHGTASRPGRDSPVRAPRVHGERPRRRGRGGRGRVDGLAGGHAGLCVAAGGARKRGDYRMPSRPANRVPHDETNPGALPTNRSDSACCARITTRWHDNDHYGHVNNVVYYAYFEPAVNGFLIEASGTDIVTCRPLGIVAATSAASLLGACVVPGHGPTRPRAESGPRGAPGARARPVRNDERSGAPLRDTPASCQSTWRRGTRRRGGPCRAAADPRGAHPPSARGQVRFRARAVRRAHDSSHFLAFWIASAPLRTTSSTSPKWRPRR